LKTKTFVVLSLCLLLVLFLALSCKKKAGKADYFAVNLFPKSMSGYILIKVDKIMELKEVKDALAKEDENVSEFLEKMKAFGLDIKKDVKHIAIGMDFTQDDMEKGLVLAFDGMFKQDAILNAIKEEGGSYETEKYAGADLYMIKAKSDNPMAMHFMNANCILAGAPNMVKQGMDLAKGNGESLETHEAMMNSLKTVDNKAQLVGTIMLADKIKQEMEKNPMSKAFAAIDAIVISGHFTDQLSQIILSANCQQEADAKQITTTLNGYWEGMAKPMLLSKPELEGLGDILTIEQKGASSQLKIAITKEQAEQLKKLQETMGGAPEEPEAMEEEVIEEEMEEAPTAPEEK